MVTHLVRLNNDENIVNSNGQNQKWYNFDNN